jgi:heat shock protein HslJ
MKTLRFITIFTFLSLLLSACTGNSLASEPNIEGVTWVLTTYNDANPIDDALPTIQFEDGQISGTTGCNHYWGSYQITEDAISFGDIFHTEIGCMEPEGVMDQERSYLDLLRSADRFELSESEKILTIFAGSHQLLTFKVKKDDMSLSTPTHEQPTITPTVIVAEPTLTPTLASPAGFKEYRDSVIGVSIYIPESWVVTGVIEGGYAIFQSYPEDKYVGGEGLEPEDTKCDLNIQPAGTSVGELTQKWESNELTTIVSDEDVVLQSGLIGQRFIIESMGRSVAFVTEINNRAIVLSCFGNPEPFEEIANTLNEFDVTASSTQDSNVGFKQYRDSETGVTLDVPGSWTITEVIPGIKATLQSLETTCELFIRSDISSADEIVTPMKSNEDITIISDDQIVLKSGQPATRLVINIEMDNIGQSMLVITEINMKVIVLSCVGNFSLVDTIAVTLKAVE